MRHVHHLLRVAGVGLAALCAGATIPASAFQNNDHVYADSFGNLVVDSAAGYKRIVVGQGHMARHMVAATAAGEPRVVYLDGVERDATWSDCYRPPVFVKGRSHMYGLSEGEMPELSPCR